MLEEMDIYIENDMALSVARTRELQNYSSARWKESFDEPLDGGQLLLFLCDESRGSFTEEQRDFLRSCRDQVYERYRKAAFSAMTGKALQPREETYRLRV